VRGSRESEDDVIQIPYRCTINELDYEVDLKIRYCQGKPGRSYMPNGDPGYPDEPDEISIEEVIGDVPEFVKDLIADKAYEDEDLYATCGEMYAEEQAAMYEALAESREDR